MGEPRESETQPVIETNPLERNRLIAHLGRVFSRRYDIQVLPSGQKGLWACSLDPKITPELERFVRGEKETLDDLPPESFVPQKILYDEQAALEMPMEEIITLLRHESGHAKYTDFRLMVEGQRQAKKEGCLPTSFWLVWEGLEDPRINNLEGEESPTIDRIIRANQGKSLQERITEAPLSQRPLLLQFAYNCFHYWLKGEPIPELVGTEVGRLGELALPLIEQYFQNSDVGQRKLLQEQIWQIARELEKKEIEQEEGRQMASEQQGQPQPGQPKPGQLSPEQTQAIRKQIEQLSPAQRERLAKKARQAVDEAQKEALEDKLPLTMILKKNEETGEYEAVPQTIGPKKEEQAKKEYQEALEQVEAEEKADWDKQEAERKQQEEMLRKLAEARREKEAMKKAGFEEEEKDKFRLYQSLENSMSALIRDFIQVMEKIIPRKKQLTYEGFFFSGPKFDRRELIRKAPLKDERFHLRSTEVLQGDPNLFIGLLVDNSGSMGGKKMEEARKTMIFLAKVCREMGIPFMAASFGQSAEGIKSFRQDFDNPAERTKPKIIDATTASEPATNLHAGIELTIQAMNEQRRRAKDARGIIFVITDGQANTGLTGEALKQYLEDNRGRLTFKAFGLSDNNQERTRIQNYLNGYFGTGNCAYPESFDDLPQEAFRILRVSLTLFQKRAI